MTLTIIKGYPIPAPFTPKTVYPFHEMEIGDHFIVLNRNTVKTATVAYHKRNPNSKRFSIRKGTDNLYRCFRI